MVEKGGNRRSTVLFYWVKISRSALFWPNWFYRGEILTSYDIYWEEFLDVERRSAIKSGKQKLFLRRFILMETEVR